MPTDETVALILTICDLLGQSNHSANHVIRTYERKMKEAAERHQSENQYGAGHES
jgi:hypothetical protein